jgi:hypothetical protein
VTFEANRDNIARQHELDKGLEERLANVLGIVLLEERSGRLELL